MTTTVTQIDAVRTTITRMQVEFGKALPAQIPAERFVRTVLTALGIKPELGTANRQTLFAACMRAAQDGLLLDGREAALVMYGDKVQYMPMVGGILKKLRQSGELSSISANVVYENDDFDYELGDEERIKHKPVIGERGKPIAAYAIVRTKDGGVYREVMSVAEVESVRQRSRAKNAGPWVTDWSEMARKTVIRRISKRLPSSSDLDSVFEADNEHYERSAAPAPALTAPEPSTPTTVPGPRPSRLKASLARRKAVTEEPILIEATPAGEEVASDGSSVHDAL